MKKTAIMAIAVATFGLSACTNLSDRDQKMLSGAAIGSGVGVVGTVITGGCVSCGAAIGGVAGAGVGYILHENDKARQ
ncbi:hypothetical protein [Thalassospira sp.]|uniref:hypothetical protein n=1 Tax=Thalassospira sp. TaxID=1912094 RepID=UPI0027328023|nr:hypothetical protein [Thalassospira sp.]MDP2699105.1 hypothetical protein [Thalassospira sp.]